MPSSNTIQAPSEPRLIDLVLGTPTALPDGATITLDGFSHKRPMVGGPTKATAYMTIATPNAASTSKLELSVHGTEGTDEQEFDGRFVGDLELVLVAFEYDHSVRLSVRSVQSLAATYDTTLALRAGQTVRFPDGVRIAAVGFGDVRPPDGGAPVKHVELSVYLDQRVEPIRAMLYENGTPALTGRWVGEKGMLIGGRRIQLVKLASDSVELVVRRE